MIQFFDCHSAAIQAMCSVLGLIGLVVYTYLTSSIRRATVRQAKASQRPLIVIDLGKEESKWLMYNKGSGPALQLYWKVSHINDNHGWNKLGALAVGDFSDIASQDDGVLLEIPKDGLRIHYSDLAGNKYCTIMKNESLVFQQDSFDLSEKDWRVGHT
jgi:hypothetical protein